MIYQSQYPTLQDAINAAYGDEIVLDVGGAVGACTIDGNVVIRGQPGKPISYSAGNLFTLAAGRHVFDGLCITGAGDNAFYTVQTYGTLWDNTFRNCSIDGGKYGYYSSNGGTPESPAITRIDNCRFSVSEIAVSVFSNEALDCRKELWVSKSDFTTINSHNLYAHPNVAIDLSECRASTGNSGKMFLHHYSGGTPGRNGLAKWVRFHKVDTANFTEMVSPNGGACQISESKINPYSTDFGVLMKVDAYRCTFSNVGNGSFFFGRAVDCAGSMWGSPGKQLDILGGAITELYLKHGCDVRAYGAGIAYASVGLSATNAAKIDLRRGSTVGSLQDFKAGTAKVDLYLPGKCNYNVANVRPGLVEIFP